MLQPFRSGPCGADEIVPPLSRGARHAALIDSEAESILAAELKIHGKADRHCSWC